MHQLLVIIAIMQELTMIENVEPTCDLLVMFEELGGDPNGVSSVRRRDIDSVCADIYEWQRILLVIRCMLLVS